MGDGNQYSFPYRLLPITCLTTLLARDKITKVSVTSIEDSENEKKKNKADQGRRGAHRGRGPYRRSVDAEDKPGKFQRDADTDPGTEEGGM